VAAAAVSAGHKQRNDPRPGRQARAPQGGAAGADPADSLVAPVPFRRRGARHRRRHGGRRHGSGLAGASGLAVIIVAGFRGASMKSEEQGREAPVAPGGPGPGGGTGTGGI
jgi:hypothetical protein